VAGLWPIHFKRWYLSATIVWRVREKIIQLLYAVSCAATVHRHEHFYVSKTRACCSLGSRVCVCVCICACGASEPMTCVRIKVTNP